jgi:predicted DNA-binding transcriptional regulator AlpA
MKTSNKGLLTAREVAERLNVCPRTIWRWTSMGRLPKPIRLVGSKATRWKEADIEAVAEGLQPLQAS